jgi:hypothetical protein
MDLHHPLFSSVTHLRLFDLGIQEPVYLQLSQLPALTHLRVSAHFPYAVLSAILAECRNLRVVVTVPNLPAASNPPVTYSRFVALLMHHNWSQSERSAISGIDFWTRADEFLTSKARGEIEGHSCLHL